MDRAAMVATDATIDAVTTVAIATAGRTTGVLLETARWVSRRHRLGPTRARPTTGEVQDAPEVREDPGVQEVPAGTMAHVVPRQEWAGTTVRRTEARHAAAVVSEGPRHRHLQAEEVDHRTTVLRVTGAVAAWAVRPAVDGTGLRLFRLRQEACQRQCPSGRRRASSGVAAEGIRIR